MTTPSRLEIIDLANFHVSGRDRAVFHFTQRDLLTFAGALLKVAPASVDTARLDAIAEAAGFVRGTDAGAPAFRVLGNDSWHPDLRAAIDDSQRTKAIAAKENQ